MFKFRRCNVTKCWHFWSNHAKPSVFPKPTFLSLSTSAHRHSKGGSRRPVYSWLVRSHPPNVATFELRADHLGSGKYGKIPVLKLLGPLFAQPSTRNNLFQLIIYCLKLTQVCPWKWAFCPKRKGYSLPSIHFQVRSHVSFRDGKIYKISFQNLSPTSQKAWEDDVFVPI